MLNGKSILITGGTGSFGRKFVRTVLKRYQPERLIIFSRDELKQFEMAQEFSPKQYPAMRYFIGDVRDQRRLCEAFHGVEIVVHAAALKQVPSCEYNPLEAVKTNVGGAENVIRASIDQGVQRIVALSTDKAASPINLYGATKLCSDKLFIAGNSMSGAADTRFSVVRYGNVVGSRGSVIPFFLKRRHEGVLPITDERMTRFSITLQEAVDFTLRCLQNMTGGELFVPKIPSYHITDVAQAIAPKAQTKIVGIRPGEKLHELMVPEEDALRTVEFEDHFIIQPAFHWWTEESRLLETGGKPCEAGFSYCSRTNSEWLTVEQLREVVRQWCVEHNVEFDVA